MTDKPAKIEKPDAFISPVTPDGLKANLERMIVEKRASRDQADLIWWLFAYARNNGWSNSRIGAEVGIDPGTVSKLFSCTYPAKVDSLCEKIIEYKRPIDAKKKTDENQMPFVMTSVAKKIHDVCAATLASQTVSMLWSETQTGKTHSLQHVEASLDLGVGKYYRMPARASLQLVAREFARACYVSGPTSYEGLRDGIFASIDANNLVMVDEVQEALLCYDKKSTISILEFFREIYDRKKCGIVFSMNNLGRDEMLKGSLAPIFVQLTKRGPIKLQLPDMAPAEDYYLIANTVFGLEEPTGEAREIVAVLRQNYGIGPFCHHLRMGERLAKNVHAEYSWSHFSRAYNAISVLSEQKAGGSK